jgi:hypothetical protein
MWAKAGPALCGNFFSSDFSFLIIFLDIGINFKMHRKYNTTQKNTKQISIESLGIDIGIRLYKSDF